MDEINKLKNSIDIIQREILSAYNDKKDKLTLKCLLNKYKAAQGELAKFKETHGVK